MKILILGAGNAGSGVAGALSSEENQITVIDYKPHLLEALKEKFNITTIVGNAAHPRILERAGVQDADLVIAVADRDETNMLACLIIDKLYNRPKTIARVRAVDFLKIPQLFCPQGIPVDIVISPEQIVRELICNLVKFPGTLYISHFGNGLVSLFSVKASSKGLLTRKTISSLKGKLCELKLRIVAIFRQGTPLLVNGASIIMEEDEVFFVAPTKELLQILKTLNKLEPPIKRIMIAGGGHIGKRLAIALENNHQVKVIEKDADRAMKIANDLPRTLVLNGDGTDEKLLIDESISATDLFCAVTESDGVNIISASLAKSLGARKSICLLNQKSYNRLVPPTGIDVAVLPNQETLGSILKYIRHGDVVEVHSLCGGTAEAIEAIAHKYKINGENSVVGQRINAINFPPGIVLGAVIRNRELLTIHHDSVIEEGDRVIMFAVDKKLVCNIEKVFQNEAQ